MGSEVKLGSLWILQKRAEFVSFQRHTVLVVVVVVGGGGGVLFCFVLFCFVFF